MRKGSVRRVEWLIFVLPVALAFVPTDARAQASPPKGTGVAVPVPLLPAPRAAPAPAPPPPPTGLGYQLVSGYERIPSGSPVSHVVSCPPGKWVVGGGVSHTNLMPKAHFHIINSYPNNTGVPGRPETYPTQWATTVMNDTIPTVFVYITYYAICVNPS